MQRLCKGSSWHLVNTLLNVPDLKTAITSTFIEVCTLSIHQGLAINGTWLQSTVLNHLETWRRYLVLNTWRFLSGIIFKTVNNWIVKNCNLLLFWGCLCLLWCIFVVFTHADTNTKRKIYDKIQIEKKRTTKTYLGKQRYPVQRCHCCLQHTLDVYTSCNVWLHEWKVSWMWMQRCSICGRPQDVLMLQDKTAVSYRWYWPCVRSQERV